MDHRADALRYLGGQGANSVSTLAGHLVPKGSTWDATQDRLRLPDGAYVYPDKGADEIGRAFKAYEDRAREERQLPFEFLAFCQAQFPELVETYKRIKLVKAQFAKFAGSAED